MAMNVPATTEAAVEPAVPATADLATPPSPAREPRQNVTAGLLPIMLAVIVLLFVALGFFTLMAATGGSL
jgi:hypothetical protein